MSARAICGEMRKERTPVWLEMQKLDLPTGPDLPENPNTIGIRTEIMDILEVNDKEFRHGRPTGIHSDQVF